MFAPVFHLTPAIAKSLMAIEAARTAIDVLPIDVPMLAILRQTAACSPRICPPGSKATV